MLCSHVLEFMKLHNFRGLLSEQSIESLHRTVNGDERRFASLGRREDILRKIVEESWNSFGTSTPVNFDSRAPTCKKDDEGYFLDLYKSHSIFIDIFGTEYDVDKFRRVEFEASCSSSFEQVEDIIARGLSPHSHQISSLLLVGGASRMPKIKHIVAKYISSECQLVTVIVAEEAAVIGTAVQASLLTGHPTLAHAFVHDFAYKSVFAVLPELRIKVLDRCNPIPTIRTRQPNICTAERQELPVQLITDTNEMLGTLSLKTKSSLWVNLDSNGINFINFIQPHSQPQLAQYPSLFKPNSSDLQQAKLKIQQYREGISNTKSDFAPKQICPKEGVEHKKPSILEQLEQKRKEKEKEKDRKDAIQAIADQQMEEFEEQTKARRQKQAIDKWEQEHSAMQTKKAYGSYAAAVAVSMVRLPHEIEMSEPKRIEEIMNRQTSTAIEIEEDGDSDEDFAIIDAEECVPSKVTQRKDNDKGVVENTKLQGHQHVDHYGGTKESANTQQQEFGLQVESMFKVVTDEAINMSKAFKDIFEVDVNLRFLDDEDDRNFHDESDDEELPEAELVVEIDDADRNAKQSNQSNTTPTSNYPLIIGRVGQELRCFEEEIKSHTRRAADSCFSQTIGDANRNEKCVLVGTDLEAKAWDRNGPLRDCSICRTFAAVPSKRFSLPQPKIKNADYCLRKKIPNFAGIPEIPDLEEGSFNIREDVINSISDYILIHSRLSFCGERKPERAISTRQCLKTPFNGFMQKHCSALSQCDQGAGGACLQALRSSKAAICECIDEARDDLKKRIAGIADAINDAVSGSGRGAPTIGGSGSKVDTCVNNIKKQLITPNNDWAGVIDTALNSCIKNKPSSQSLGIDSLLNVGCRKIIADTTGTASTQIKTGFDFVNNLIDAMVERSRRFCGGAHCSAA
uniref:Hypoxia up-regulated protein 1 n=1 Tax=Ditylenchus dipsaci TaxID=166011 RepID=A0A915DRD3_9BILA